MALCLDELVLRGELFNTRWYSVHGWLELKGHDSPLMLQLTGNCSPELAGWHFHFEARGAQGEPGDSDSNDPPSDEDRQCIKRLKIAWQQIGPTGPMSVVGLAPPSANGAAESATAASTMADSAAPSPPDAPPRLHLEWHSQNGHVTLDLADPIVEFVDFSEIKFGVRNPRPKLEVEDDDADDDDSPESADSAGEDLGYDDELGDNTDIYLPELDAEGGDGDAPWSEDDEEDDEEDDPYGLFPSDLAEQLEPEEPAADWTEEPDDETDEAMRELELMDDLIENSPGEPVGEIFDRPVRLPLPADIDDQQAEQALKSLLAEMALFGIALDICEHYTPRDAYRLLIEEICKEERAYPELRQTQWVQQFMTSEFCEACDAEFQREDDERERKRRESGEPPDDDIPF